MTSALNLPLWRESRIGLELAALLRDPVFRGHDVQDGAGQPVLLIPGLLAGDDSLRIMGRWLKRTGHYPARAGIRMNVSCSGATVDKLEKRLEDLVHSRGSRAAVIGHSRGGGFAKVLGRTRPDLVSGVITLGCPHTDTFAVHPLVRAQIETIATLGTLGVRGFFSRGCLKDKCCADFWDAALQPPGPGVGYVSVYSRRDGVVRWQSCLDPHAEHIEVSSTHCGMAVHPEVFRTVASSLESFRRTDARRRPRKPGATVAPLPRAA